MPLGNPEKAGGGRLICDHRGEWSKGFSRGIGSTMVLKTGTVKEPEKELITGFMVGLGFDRWSNR